MPTAKSQLGFAFLCLIFTALFRTVIWQTFSLAWRDEESNYILLILPISIALIVAQWRALPRTSVRSSKSGLVFLGLAALLALLSRWWLSVADIRLSIGMLAVVSSWVGASVLCFGPELATALRFPLGFLLCLIPIPSTLALVLAHAWQWGSASFASFLFSVVNVPTSTNGAILYIPGFNFEVARECSSLRSSFILIVTAMVLAHLFLQTTWRKALIVMLAVPISIAKNGLRIFTIGLLSIKVDASFLSGRLHHEGGFIFFSAALLAVLGFLWIARKTEALNPDSFGFHWKAANVNTKA